MGRTLEMKKLEKSIKNAKQDIARNALLIELRKNKAFIALIEEDYFEKEAARLVAAMANPGLQTEEQQKFIENSMIGIGSLQQYFNKVYGMAEQAIQSLEADEATEVELLGLED